MEWFEDIALRTASSPPSVWFRYVNNTFTMVHEYHVDEFTVHLNSMDSNISLTKELEQDGTLSFLDTYVNINDDGVHLSQCTVNPPTQANM